MHTAQIIFLQKLFRECLLSLRISEDALFSLSFEIFIYHIQASESLFLFYGNQMINKLPLYNLQNRINILDLHALCIK